MDLVVGHEDVAAHQLGRDEELAAGDAGAVQGGVRQLHEHNYLKGEGKKLFFINALYFLHKEFESTFIGPRKELLQLYHFLANIYRRGMNMNDTAEH